MAEGNFIQQIIDSDPEIDTVFMMVGYRDGYIKTGLYHEHGMSHLVRMVRDKLSQLHDTPEGMN